QCRRRNGRRNRRRVARQRALPDRRDADATARARVALRGAFRTWARYGMGLCRRHAVPAAVPRDDRKPVSLPALEPEHEYEIGLPRTALAGMLIATCLAPLGSTM